VFAASPSFAQDATRAPVPHDQVLSANPFGLMFEWFNADHETVRLVNVGIAF
jgi:hypothetical protein